MTKMLASVNSLEEAQLILNTLVDIIDLKQPELGALGALDIETVKKIVQLVNQQKQVSATIGDIPMQAEPIFKATSTMAATGVNYIKIGFFPDGDWLGTLSKLADLTKQGHQLIAVLFADTQPDFEIIKTIKETGFSGIMLDTMDKSKGSLSTVMPVSKIKDFVKIAKEFQLLSGLAGSLNQEDIPGFIRLTVDYLGFRGALCKESNRVAQLDKEAVDSIISCFVP